MQKLIKYLLKEGCPSIKYRIKKEIYGELDSRLQQHILDDQEVKKFISLQNETGWIDEDFHSEKGVEAAVRVFFEKGLESDYPAYNKLLYELEQRDATFDNGCLYRVGKILDSKGFGGSQLIRATLFAYAGLENRLFVRKQIEEALDVFRYITNINAISEITEKYKNKLVFSEGVMWPSIYHLRLLAHTKNWRNEKNKKMLVNSIKKLIQFSPIPEINVLERSQLISPASFCMNNFNPSLDKLKDNEWMMWFHRMELLSRLGVVTEITELKQQVEIIIKFMEKSDGLFTKRMNHYYFRKWGPYTGLALEKDWRTSKRRVNDLSFRCLLIIFYSGIN
ncbi:hypothetical protein [Caloranaerobacter ferrireducens]|uniref:hypothetical protein n=1 Tax=Caloranaerobacter ferrireducens TaxID=1323370 RepID=UPI00084D65E9|nr:hypothetical protein [Caloranaerobacter ferrireducens]